MKESSTVRLRGALAGVACLASGLTAGPAGSRPMDSAVLREADAAHVSLLASETIPSAAECRNCHPNHYEEWAVSQHAYAQLSPIFNAMHGTILKKTNGTSGDFCIRCHSPAGMLQDEPLFTSNLNRSQVSREGVTCATCHRIDRPHGKVSGRLSLRTGPLSTPVTGPTGGEELRRVLSEVASLPTDESGRQLGVHVDAVEMTQMSDPGFCASCHDVTLLNGLRLEEAFSEYKSSPAARRGTTCQDCHMGTVPGRESGYRHEPAAFVGGRPTRPRKRTDHRFVGPDHSVIHPGLFPFDERGSDLARPEDWLGFDWEAGWGTDDFEASPEAQVTDFPEPWADLGDRYDAREILDESIGELKAMAELRLELLRNGYLLDEPTVELGRKSVRIRTAVRNGTDGHAVPTGFSAERLVWLRLVVRDAEGRVVFESGDLDPDGDLRDGHGGHVRAGLVPRDDQLFSLQSKFVLRNVREGEREEILAVNHASDPLPFVRPDPRPTVLNGGPAGARVQSRSIEPLGVRRHVYRIPRRHLDGAGPHHVRLELKAGMLPVNLIREIQDVGFDYGMSAAEIAQRVVDGHQVLWAHETTIDTEEGS